MSYLFLMKTGSAERGVGYGQDNGNGYSSDDACCFPGSASGGGAGFHIGGAGFLCYADADGISIAVK